MPRFVETLRFMVHAWECDEFGHVNVRHYMGWVADAALSLIATMGFDRASAAALDLGYAGVRAEVDFKSELNGGDVVRMETAIVDVAERKLTFEHRMRRVGDGVLVMSARIVVVCLHLKQRKAHAWPPALLQQARALAEAPADAA
ncbi:MAG TPA: thioesterase family protein [Candidatus Cybelea sp.]|nr:thioesterase family protein [Candidatus Cybelea sp.]